MRNIAFLFLIAFSTYSFSFAQEAKHDEKTKSDEEKTKEIAEAYKDTVVAVETIFTLEDGRVGGAAGSGFFVDSEGHILTNAHVVRFENYLEAVYGEGAPKVSEYTYWVTMQKSPANRSYKAKLVGWNRYVDSALLKIDEIDKAEYKPAKLGDSDTVTVGETVFAYGNPHGLSNSFTKGIVSGLHRTGYRFDHLWYIQDFIQTDAPINPGNSGGPLINSNGEVIGINSAGYRGADGLGFAVPLKLADIARLKKGEVKIGYFGAEVMLDQFDRTGKPGNPGFRDIAYLNQVTGIEDLKSLELLANSTWERWTLVLKRDNHDSPAERAGLQRGDLITHFNGVAVKSGREMRLVMLDVEPEKEFEVKVLRVEKGAFKDLTLKVSLAKEKKK
jgi:serine protease Do